MSNVNPKVGVYDCVVVGAGIEGSATAYQFAKENYTTLLLEQFPLPHSRGSSHGQSRIIRCAYKEIFFSHMVKDALKLWNQLEKETNTQIFVKTGLLCVDRTLPYDGYREYLAGIHASQRHHELYSGSELNHKFPGAVNYNNNDKVMVELDAGLLKADKALRCFQEQFVKFGGTLHDGERVVSVIPMQDAVTVNTSKGQYKTKRLVLAAGPWSSQMLKPLGLDLPLECQKINVCYWKEKIPGSFTKFPCFIDLSTGNHVYGLQSHEYPGLMKVCYHIGAPLSNPDERDYQTNQDDIKILSRYITKHLPGLENKPAITESCMYTVTPDELPIIGTLPKYSNIAFVCGMSGTGFKLAPIIGKLMRELVTGHTPCHDLSHFRYQRFFNNHLKSTREEEKDSFTAKL